MGGQPAYPGGPGGYAYFADSAQQWKSFMFTSADPSIADAAAAMRRADPCGDTNSFTPTVLLDNQRVSQIRVPVLLLYGTSDAIYQEPQAGETQRGMFTGSHDVTLHFFGDTGHALTLERSAPSVRAVASRWLTEHGF
jgi:pimeloyl-ACP methyl ester carboxylesterase